VDADLGITFLPAMARGTALLRNTRVKLSDMSERSFRTIGMAWRKGSNRGEEFKELGEFFLESHYRNQENAR
jgi:LysR family transcriptional regulator, hydrogen peroxide-inducible genes activator